MKLQKILGLSAIAMLASPFVMAQSQGDMSESSQMESQPMQNQAMSSQSEMKDRVQEGVAQLDERYNLDLSQEQSNDLTQAFIDSQIGLQDADSQEEIRQSASDYQQEINDILTEEQRQKILDQNNVNSETGSQINRGQELGNAPNQ